MDVNQGETQILIVRVKYSKDSITNQDKVLAVYHTDHSNTPIKLKLKRADGPPLIAVWEGKWVPQDSYQKVYQVTIRAISGKKESKVDLTFR